MDKSQILSIIKKQRDFFSTNQTKTYDFRITQLKKLKSAIEINEASLLKALYDDLRKSEFEAYAGEVGFVIAELDFSIKNLKKWMKSKKTKTPLLHQPGSSFIVNEPLGSVLIIGPWNYPFQLLFAPLIGAIAAGNTVIMKSSELAPKTSSVMHKIISETFEANYISLIEGEIQEATDLLNEKFDHIFFTGSTNVGKIVMQAAAKNLTPVTLELGGKSPCIVDKASNLQTTARRIVWGKFFNAGQTCIAPDYLIVQKDVKSDLISLIKKEIENFYGENPQESKDYPRIINERHFNRLISYLEEKKVAIGGKFDLKDKYISPTVMDNVDWSDNVMKDEIFGPILPVLEYEVISEAIKIINDHPKPLALYLFSNSKIVEDKVLSETSSGGVCINDTLSHITTNYLPFGGVGDSGMGDYHGIYSFEAFSHRKSVMKKNISIDPPIRYAPYKLSLKNLKKMLRFIG
jgi:acyl-CoA reductase-like NAD-dependent aldehyde dehydrogenase